MEILLWSLGRSLVRIETLGTARWLFQTEWSCFGSVGNLQRLEFGINAAKSTECWKAQNRIALFCIATSWKRSPPIVVSREAATSFQWIFKDDGYGIVRYRAATKIAQLSGEIRQAFGTVPRRLEPAVRNRQEPAELNLGETIELGKSCKVSPLAGQAKGC